MATVIDSLFIELGLDTSKFDSAQKKSVEQLRKFDEANQKTQKNLQKTAKDTTEGFEKSRDALISFGTATLSVAGFAGFISSMTTTNAALGRNANLFNMSARELDAWGGVLKSVGGTADEFQSSIQALQSGVANVQLGNPALLTALGQLGARSGVGLESAIDYKKNTVDIYKLADAFKKLKDNGQEQLGLSLAGQMGINKNFFFVLEQGSDSVRKLYDESYKLSGVNIKNVEQAQKLQKEFGHLSNAFSGTKNSIMDGLYPALHNMFQTLEFGMESFTKFNDKTDHWASNIIVLSGAVLTLNKAMKILGVTATTGVWVAAGKLFASLAMLLHSENVGETPEELEELRKQNQVTGGSRNQRNQNPGNLKYTKFSKAHGAIGQDAGGFAIFSSMEDGQKALDDLLVGAYYNKGQRSISSIIGGVNGQHAYSTTDQASYIDFLSKKLGINPNQELSLAQLHGMAGAIPQFEGMSGAQANTSRNGGNANTITSNVQNLNVYSNTNDPNKMLNDIERAAQNNPIIASGIAGAR